MRRGGHCAAQLSRRCDPLPVGIGFGIGFGSPKGDAWVAQASRLGRAWVTLGSNGTSALFAMKDGKGGGGARKSAPIAGIARNRKTGGNQKINHKGHEEHKGRLRNRRHPPRQAKTGSSGSRFCAAELIKRLSPVIGKGKTLTTKDTKEHKGFLSKSPKIGKLESR